jgi:hypothetical protein
MVNERAIVVSSGLKPVHSFDLWGVLIDQYVVGERKIDLYREIARLDMVPEDEIKRVVQDYRDLLDGESWATGLRRSEIIDALEGEKLANDIQIDYTLAFMQDALIVMGEILETGEGVLIFTSKPAPDLGEQLGATLGRNIGEVRWGNKGDPAIFRSMYELEKGLGNHLVSHTADELPELVAAKESGLFPPNSLIYINRNESNSENEVRKAGIGRYVNDLRNIEYTSLSSSESLG